MTAAASPVQAPAITPDEALSTCRALVYSIVGGYLKRCSVDREDLIQQGMLGLVQATYAWDPKKGNSFATHARLYIRARIVDEIKDQIRQCGRITLEDAGELPDESLLDDEGDDFFGELKLFGETVKPERAELLNQWLGVRQDPQSIAALARQHGRSPTEIRRRLRRTIESYSRRVLHHEPDRPICLEFPRRKAARA